MSDTNKDELVANFTTVTGVDADRARFYLEASGWNLDLAMGSFYQEEDEGGMAAEPEARDSPSPPPSAAARPARQAKAQSRFATLSTLRGEEASSDEEEEGQKFYAGGSEHGGGQQIIGPPKKKNTDEIVQDMFKSAKEHGAEEVAAGSSSAGGPRAGRPQFKGTGYRLGESEAAPSDMVHGEPMRQPPRDVDMVLKLWKNGFSVDDGPLRDFQDPTNADFLTAIKRGEVPAELTRLARGGEVNLDMEDHRGEEYVKPKVPVRAFAGEGHRLGSVAPNLSAASATAGQQSESAAKSAVEVDSAKPTTNVQIRLADGSRLVAKFNHSHTVGDIRTYIETSRPQLVGANYVLMTTFPNKELSDLSQTLEEGKLLSSAIVQRMK